MSLDMRLAYRMASNLIDVPLTHFPPGIDLEAVRNRVQGEAELIKKIPCFIFDNVAEFYAANSKMEWDLKEDIPNWAPPFQFFFVEWNEAHNWNLPKGQDPFEIEDTQGGLVVLGASVTDKNRNQTDNWKFIIEKFAGGQLGSSFAKTMESLLKDSKWVILCSPWFSCSQKPVCGKAIWMGLVGIMFVSKTGKLLEYMVTGPAAESASRQLAEIDQVPMFSVLTIMGLGISFLHCKNVVRTETEDNRGERWHRRTKVPVLKFHTLEINPMKEVLRKEGRSEETGIQKALHICRGHFAHYTEDNPLFGKYVGDFWKPQHVRGKASEGVVFKDYKVNLGTQVGKPEADSGLTAIDGTA